MKTSYFPSSFAFYCLIYSLDKNTMLFLMFLVILSGGTKVGTNATPDAVVNSHSKEKNMDDESIGIIIGALTALILLLFLVGLILIVRHRKRKHGQTNQRMLKSFEPRHVTLNLNDLRLNTTTAAGVVPQANGKVVNGNMYNSVATSDLDLDKDTAKFSNLVASAYGEPFDGIQTRKLPELPKTPESTGKTGRYYRQYHFCWWYIQWWWWWCPLAKLLVSVSFLPLFFFIIFPTQLFTAMGPGHLSV